MTALEDDGQIFQKIAQSREEEEVVHWMVESVAAQSLHYDTVFRRRYVAY